MKLIQLQNNLNEIASLETNEDKLAAYLSIISSLQKGKLIFKEEKKGFEINIKQTDFNVLKIDEKLYNVIHLPFEVTIYNNTFMATKFLRLVSRKTPKTIGQFTNIEFPFFVDIGESKSFLLFVSINDWKDIDQLIRNDLAYVFYTDNTTLSEIDFAIDVPDIRGITHISFQEVKYYSLDKQYTLGLNTLDDIIVSFFHFLKRSKAFRYFNSFIDTSQNLTNKQLEFLLETFHSSDDIFNDSKFNKELYDISNFPKDFQYALYNFYQNNTLKNKCRFNVTRLTQLNGITYHKTNISYNEANTLFNEYRISSYKCYSDDITEQQRRLDLLFFQVRIPQFGTDWLLVDINFIISNINDTIKRITNLELGEYLGQHIDASSILNLTPIVPEFSLQYDISSQVKENLISSISIHPFNYFKFKNTDPNYGYKIINIDQTTYNSNIFDVTDTTFAYIHHRPIDLNSNNQIIFSAQDSLRNKILAFDQTSYFGGSIPENNFVNLGHFDITIELQKTNPSNHQVYDNTFWIFRRNIKLSISDKIIESFKIIMFDCLDNGENDFLTTYTSNQKYIQMIYYAELFNSGNTFLNITDIKQFFPTKLPFADQQHAEGSDYFVPINFINNDTLFYNSLIENISVVCPQSITPGETARIFFIIRLNYNLLDHIISQYLKIPFALKITFNTYLHYYLFLGETKVLSSIIETNTKSFPNLYYHWPWVQEAKHYVPEKLILDDEDVNSLKYGDDFGRLYRLNTPSKYDISHYENDFVRMFDIQSKDPTIELKNIVFQPGIYTAFSYPIIIPYVSGLNNISRVEEILYACYNSNINDIKYKFHFLYFWNFFEDMLNSYRNECKQISLSYVPMENNVMTIYNKNNFVTNTHLSNTTQYKLPLPNVQWFSKITAHVTFIFSETVKNVFEFRIPKFQQLRKEKFSMESLFMNETIQSDWNPIKGLFVHDIDLGEITGSKSGVMTINTNYYHLIKFKSIHNFSIKKNSIGPDSPDTFTISIQNPLTEHGNIIINFLNRDYTFDFHQKCHETSFFENIGNVIISPDYINLKYIPIDETYAVTVRITNPNPFPVDITALNINFSNTSFYDGAIEFIKFPSDDTLSSYNQILFDHWILKRQPYRLASHETVKLFLRIVPRRIGVNFYTIFIKVANSIKPINIEFRSFVNNKPYFIIDDQYKKVDFGTVPIGKTMTKSIVISNIGDIMGKVNSIYLFGNDAQHFKILDPTKGGQITERLSFNKVVLPKTELKIPVRFYSRSYGFNTSYAYVETNEPVVDMWFDDETQVQRNAPKYLSVLLKGQSILENEVAELDSYIFLGYVDPTRSRFRNYEISIHNKDKNNILSIIKISNILNNYIKIKYSSEPFDEKNSIYITLNPRTYTTGTFYDQLLIQYLVHDKMTNKRKVVLHKVVVSWVATKDRHLMFDVNAEEILFVSKPFMKNMKKIIIYNYSNADATLTTHLLNDFSGLFTIVPQLENNSIIIPEGVRFDLQVYFGGDQRFYGKYQTSLTLMFNIDNDELNKIITLTGIIGDNNYIKIYKRKQFIIV